MILPAPLLALSFGLLSPVLAAKPGGFEDGGDTLVSAMMVRSQSLSPFSLALTTDLDVCRERGEGVYHGQG